MAAPIVDATGLHVPTVEEVNDDYVADERATISPNIDTEADAIVGQINGIHANAMRLALEALPVAYNAFDIENADFNRLKALSRLTGTYWRDETKGIVLQRVTLDPGTTFVPGLVVSDGSGDPTHRWVSTETRGPVAGGNYTIVFEAETPGPIAAPAGTLTTIETPISGWTATTNLDDAAAGLPAETEEELRARQQEEIFRLGGGTANAITADVGAVEGVLDVTTLYNDGDFVDANGLAPHSIHVIIYDGIIPAAEDAVIARAIFNTKGAGVNTNGSTLVQVPDSKGDTHPIRFSRVTLTPVTIVFGIGPTGNEYPGNAAVAASVAEASVSIQGNGSPMRFSNYLAVVEEIPGVRYLGYVALNGGAPNTDLIATPFERFTVDSSDVSFVVV